MTDPTPLPEVPRFDPPERADVVEEATQLRVPAASLPPAADDRTIIRPPTVVAPHAAPPATPVVDVAPTTGTPPPKAQGAPSPPVPGTRRGLWVALSVAAVVVITLVIVGLNVLVAGIQTPPEATETSEPQDVVSDFVPKVVDLSGSRQGEVTVFTWLNKDPQEGDTFIWNVVDVTGQVDPQQTATAVAQVAAASGTVCIDVMLRREDGRISEPARGCVDG